MTQEQCLLGQAGVIKAIPNPITPVLPFDVCECGLKEGKKERKNPKLE